MEQPNGSNSGDSEINTSKQTVQASSAKSAVTTKQKAVRQKIEQYFQRLTQGCDRENCTNPHCASNPARQKMSGNEAAVEAIKLLRQKAVICLGITDQGQPKPDAIPQPQTITKNESEGGAMECSESQLSTGDADVVMTETSEGSEPSALEKQAAQSSEQPTTSSPEGGSTVANPMPPGVVHVKATKYLTEEMVDDFLEQCKNDEIEMNSEMETGGKQTTKDPYSPIVRIVGKVFSNQESLNRSFLLKKNESPNKENSSQKADETKMETDQPVNPVDSKDLAANAEGGAAPATSSQENYGPFISLLNSLMNTTTNVEDVLMSEMPSTGGTLVSQAGESSGLRRSNAMKKKVLQKVVPPKKTVSVLQPTVDIQAVRNVYQKILGIEKVETALVNSLEMLALDMEVQHNILRQLNRGSYPKQVDLNCFLIIMENPLLHSPEYLVGALPAFCGVLAGLPVQAQAVLARYWSQYSADRLKTMVQCLQQLLTYKVLSINMPEDSGTHRELHKNDTVVAVIKCMNILYNASLLGGEVDRGNDTRGTVKSTSNQLNDLPSLMGFDDDDSLDDFGKVWKDPLGEELGMTVNDCKKPLVPHDEFENELLNSSFDVYYDFICCIGAVNKSGADHFTFMHYPFVLSTVNKTTYLFYDNKVQMMSGRRMMVLHSIVHGSALSPYLRLKIRRDHVIEDSLVRLELIAEENPQDLRKQLYVEFEGEQGVDEGGVSKEFFQLVVEQIFNPDYGMFTYDEDTNLFWFNAHSLETKAQFTLIGIVLGLAIYNNCILDVKFPSLVYKKLLGKKARFEDMADSHPVLFRSLKQLLEYAGDVEEDILAAFSVEYSDMFGINHIHALKEGGETLPVTKENREEYVHLYADWLLNESISDQFSSFRRGFELVVAKSPLKYMFRPEELEILISGSRVYDIKQLESTTDYDGGFTSESETVRHFWSVVYEMSEDEQKRLLQFTTGTDRAPVGGLSQIKLVIARNGPDSERLPTAHTCFNVILLPDYKNLEKLKERLHKAITYSKGFGML